MARFSDRIGVTKTAAVLQLNSMNDDLANSLWNALAITLEDIHSLNDEFGDETEGSFFIKYMWINFFKSPLDELPTSWREARDNCKEVYTENEWFEVYNFIEVALGALRYVDSKNNSKRRETFRDLTNHFLEKEMSGYRVIGDYVAPITSEEEVTAVKEALVESDNFQIVATHIKAAVALMSDKKSPDYRNSIKESISAVEAACRIITGDTKVTLGQALKALETKGVNVHPALRQGFEKIYGWSSDSNGIRHSMTDEPNLNFNDAKFMLIACSAFTNFLKSSSTS
ncbi:MAG TPA: hypothetical protein VFS04_02080 [Alphaproteobacteria bacterium]|nr:hypothetical protein [Alphaproteobacteria bacterium]